MYALLVKIFYFFFKPSKLISAVAIFHRACLGQVPFLRNPYLSSASLRVNETVAFPIKNIRKKG